MQGSARQQRAAEFNYTAAIRCDLTLVDAYRALAALQKDADAARTLDQLVASNPQQARAWFDRAEFLRRQGHDTLKDDDRQALFARAAADLERATKLGEPDADVLCELAELAMSRGRTEEARAAIKRGQQAFPQDPRFPFAAARLEIAARNRKAAIQQFRLALEQSPRRNDIMLPLADLLIQEHDWKEAEAIEKKMSQAGVSPSVLECLQARALLEKSQWLEASRLLEKARAHVVSWPELAVRADVWLATCYGHLGDPARQQEVVLRRALSVAPASESACMAMGDLLLAKGLYSKALDTYRPAAASSPYARLRAAYALVQYNLTLPPLRRRWEEVDKLLEPLSSVPGVATELTLLQADVLGAKDEPAQAAQKLAAAAAEHPLEPAFWTAQATLLERQGKWPQALDLLDAMEKKLGHGADVVLAHPFLGRARRRRSPGCPEDTGDSGGSAGQKDGRRLIQGLGEAWLRVGDKAQAPFYARRAEQDPTDLGVRLVLFELSLQTNQDGALSQILAQMRDIEGDEGTYWRLGEVRRQLAVAQAGKQKPADEVRRLLTEIAARRPNWSGLMLAQAQYEDLSGRPEAAIRKYQQAIAAGENDATVLRRAAVLLYERRRFLEADQLLQRLQQSPQPLLAGLDQLAAELALVKNDADRAVRLARQAVAADSRDPRELPLAGPRARRRQQMAGRRDRLPPGRATERTGPGSVDCPGGVPGSH